RATAASYVISPAAFAAVAPDPARSPDQLSALWMVALAARMVREVGELVARARRARRPLATFALDAEVRFASASDRAAFAAELSDAVEGLAAKYHDAFVPAGRKHRLIVALHPTITRPATEDHSPGSQSAREEP
ncbi:MAG TPA: ArsR family transcriptional regulator, partial [Solirubrobacteraceae bacterium]|nr:ArsR family transcriptional regulator [Solirubrobacteraceae bacterium]